MCSLSEMIDRIPDQTRLTPQAYHLAKLTANRPPHPAEPAEYRDRSTNDEEISARDKHEEMQLACGLSIMQRYT